MLANRNIGLTIGVANLAKIYYHDLLNHNNDPQSKLWSF